MKLSLPKQNTTMTTKEPLLPLAPKALIEELDKSNSVLYECCTTPNDANSVKYKLSVHILMGGEDICTILTWLDNVLRVLEGMNITTIGPKCTMVETMMQGTPLTLFQSHIRTQAEARYNAALAAAADNAGRAQVQGRGVDHYRHNDHFVPALQHMFTNLIPTQALPRIKRYLRRECCKPADMKVRTYFQHLIRICVSELPEIPPFAQNQSLATDEIIDIIIYGVPKTWIREMDRQGFDPWTHTPQEVVTFLEQIETAEDFEGKQFDSKEKTAKKTAKNGNKKAKGSKESSGQKYCKVHGQCNHTTEDCRSLKNGDGKTTPKKFGNKTWSKKANDASKETKKELAAFVKKAVAKGIQKELASINKKRKSDSDDEFDMAAFDAELKEFNCKDLDNLKINEVKDGKVSV